MPLMSPEDAFQILNISGEVTPDEIKHAYRITTADVYRTLVRAGYIFPLPPHTTETSTSYRSPSMSPTLSNESSETVDSFVHLNASSFESHCATIIPNMDQGTGRRQGRHAGESTATRSSKGNGPTSWKPFSSFLPHHSDNADYQTDVPSPLPNSDFPTSSSPASNPPYAIPLQSIGIGIGGEWTYALSLTLEELFHGRRCRFNISRSYLSRKTKKVIIEIEVPPGCRPGTRIVCRHVGHECRPGVFQDIAFVVEEAKHNRFVRLFDDLIAEVRLHHIRKDGGDVSFVGIDGASLAVRIEYPRDKRTTGRSVIQGAGMPIRERGRVVGRGNLVVQWEIPPPQTKILHFLKRLIGRK